MAKDTSEKDEISGLLNKYKDFGAVRGDDPIIKIKWLDTGIDSLNIILGGGIPRNRITEIIGPYATGKTYLCQKMMAHVQKQGGKVAFIDAELKADPEWFETTGIDLSQLLLIQDNRGEKVLDATMELVKDFDLVVVDSVAALVPQSEAKTEMKQDLVGAQARMYGKFFRKALSSLRPQEGGKAALVMINQVRSSIGGYIQMDAYPGGKAQMFYSSIIMKVSRQSWSTEEAQFKRKNIQRRTGFDIIVKTEKNSVHRPYLVVSIPFNFSGQIDEIRSIVRVGVDEKIIENHGRTYSYKDLTVGNRKGFMSQIRQRPDLIEELAKEIVELGESIYEQGHDEEENEDD